MNFRKIYLLLLIIPIFAFSIHKYYISLCEIEYVKKQKTVQIILGVFVDDLEFSVESFSGKQLNLMSKKEIKDVDSYFLQYLNAHLNFSINQKAQTYRYIGKEYDGDMVRFYLEISGIKELKSIEITNTILIKEFEDQQNIVKIKANNVNKTFYLNKDNDKGLLKF